MIRVKQYNMSDEFIDIVATFPKNCYGPQLPDYGDERPEGKRESYWNEIEQDKKMELNQERSIQRTRTKVKRYVIHKNMKYMWTLTFATKMVTVGSGKKAKTYDAGTLDGAWHLWKNFLKRCSRAGVVFDYVVTIEVQEKRLEKYGEKVYHFHFATGSLLPIDEKKAKMAGAEHGLINLWGHGRINVRKQKSKKKFANLYLMKYITKMFGETKGAQRYRCSENMSCPVETLFFPNESALDWYVMQLTSNRDLDKPYKGYFPLSNGYNEILFYGITPKETVLDEYAA